MPRFNTFDEVVSWYERTPVLKSHLHPVEQDVRPIGNRRRKYERIIKFDENTYVLTDGTYDRTLFVGQLKRHMDSTKAMGPIVWERRTDGDYITVTNHLAGNVSYSRYEFLRDYLPIGMSFEYGSGKWEMDVATSVGYQRFKLPKSRARFTRDSATNDIVLTGKVESLVFKAVGGNKFDRAGDLMWVKTKRVDKERKRAAKPHIKRILEDVYLFGGMLDTTTAAMQLYGAQLGINIFQLQHRKSDMLANELDRVRFALLNPESDNYMAALAVVINLSGFHRINSERRWMSITEQQAKANFNNVMNFLLDLHVYEAN